MDPSSSSVGFSVSGNTQSPQNSTPLLSSVKFPPFRSTQSYEISLPLPSSPVANPSSEDHQYTQSYSSLHPPFFSVPNPSSTNLQCYPEQQLYYNEPPMLIGSGADWNRELPKLFRYLNFPSFMRGGACGQVYTHWYECMYRAVNIGGDTDNCSRLAGLLRDCISSNMNYYHPLLVHFANINRRR